MATQEIAVSPYNVIAILRMKLRYLCNHVFTGGKWIFICKRVHADYASGVNKNLENLNVSNLVFLWALILELLDKALLGFSTVVNKTYKRPTWQLRQSGIVLEINWSNKCCYMVRNFAKSQQDVFIFTGIITKHTYSD